MALVSVAGPVANLLMALFFALPVRLGLISPELASGWLPTAAQFFFMGIYINLVLLVFNLLPVPPLDGFTILLGLLPPEMAYRLSGLRQYGQIIIIAILVLPSLAGFSIFSVVIDPILSILIPILTGIDLGAFYFFLWA
jgi:Zn-dependent protease